VYEVDTMNRPVVARILWASSPACFRLVASLRLSGAESCRECLDHIKRSGHFRSEVFWQQVPGQRQRLPILRRMRD